MASGVSNSPELTREQVQAILIQPLEQASVFLASGPRIFDTDGSPVRVPKLTVVTDPSWHGENEQIDEKDPDFGEVTLLPQTMKSVKVITRFSNELARQSVVALAGRGHVRPRLRRAPPARVCRVPDEGQACRRARGPSARCRGAGWDGGDPGGSR